MTSRIAHIVAPLASLALALAFAPARAQSFQSAAPQAILYDVNTRSVLFEKDADKPTPPASLAKVMTAAVVFEEIEKGRLKLDDEMVVSAYAWRKGGAVSGNAAMFLTPRQRPKVSELISGMVVVSGNDAAITLAEGIAGSEENFAKLMNQRAKELGLKNSVFVNPTGLPEAGQAVSMRDLVLISDHIIRAYPQLYPLFSQKEFTWGKTRQANRNPLLGAEAGADGLQTGNSNEGGYGLVGSASVNGQRLILAVNGLKSAADRAVEARKLLDWGFRSFEPFRLFRAGAVIEEAKVFGGAKSSVGLVAKEDVGTLVPRGDAAKMVASVSYRAPLLAPIKAGTEVARLRMRRGDIQALDVPLYAAEDVERGSLTQRAADGAFELVTGSLRRAVAKLFQRGQT
ncbi:MAG: D-alanyl-D-alanine carboxypeptidase [Beijerinckiaceae bacterium]|nr:D-alanyl-D-alanine carboxypeptidase [Beijerinckiaceae bacterium]